MKKLMLAAAGAVLVLSGCETGQSAYEKKMDECRDSVSNRAGQGEYGTQPDAVFKDDVGEAYEDCMD